MISRTSFNGAFPIRRLSEVVEFLDSQRRPVTESDRRAGPYPYYGANGQQGTIDDFIFDEPLVLLAEDGGHFGEPDRSIAYRISGKTWVNNHAHVLRPTSAIDIGYLCRVLENYDVTPFVTGTTRGKLTKAGASEIPIPVPPLAEQQRIAEVLDRAEALRAKRRAALVQLDSFTQSLFLDLFGDLPEKDTARLDELAELKRGPFGGALKKEIFVESGYKIYEQKNAIQNDFTIGRYFISDRKYKEMEDFAVIANDLIVSCSGTFGKVAIAPNDAAAGIINQALLRVRPNTARVTSLFLKHALEQPAVQSRLARYSHGTGLQNFPPMAEVRALRVPAPSSQLQREFARRVSAVEKLKTAQRASLAELDTLFATLQHRAFRGEL